MGSFDKYDHDEIFAFFKVVEKDQDSNMRKIRNLKS